MLELFDHRSHCSLEAGECGVYLMCNCEFELKQEASTEQQQKTHKTQQQLLIKLHLQAEGAKEGVAVAVAVAGDRAGFDD